MANHLQTEQEPSLTQLVTGIVTDAQELFKQQLKLFQTEFKEDLRNTKEAVVPIAIGVGVALFGSFFLFFMLAHLLHWAWPDTLPLWACFGIVGGVLTALGVVLFFVGRNKFASFNPLPDKSVDALKENVQWLTTNTTKK